MKRLAVCFSGPSNSGKTTLICKISNELIKQGFKIAIIKHDPKDKAVFDTNLGKNNQQKDSAKFTQTGADVVVLSPKRTSVFLQNVNKNVDDVIKIFDDFDYLLVEGLKTLNLPRISIMRDVVDDDYISFSDAFVTNVNDERLKIKFGLDDITNIIEWINKNAKKV